MAGDIENDIPACLTYAFQDGIGGDSACQLQIVADQLVSTSEDVTLYEQESIFDTVKVNLFKTGSVYKALQLCKSAKSAKWCVFIGCEEHCSETNDTFIADFAVAVGAGQFASGGFESGECVAKYNRILQIIREEGDNITYVGKRFRLV